VSEQERGREGAERARAHLARAESELEAAQRFVEPEGGGEADLALARGTRQRESERRRGDGNGAYDAERARRPGRRWTAPLEDPISIHPSAWKRSSANFTCRGFYEVGRLIRIWSVRRPRGCSAQ
jgi:hypothetical protein